jgi:methionyl-tRNA formyltransferase
MKPRAIFFGTPEIAVPALRALSEQATVTAVVCQPDKPVGRGSTPAAPATKRAAIELGIPVHQPLKVRTPDFLAWVREQAADVGVVMAYGRILTREVLDAPRLGCINLHASILPRYRGAAPINWCIMNGETETGISLMQMDEGVDTGPVFSVRKLAIGADERADELAARMALLGAEVVRLDLPRAMAGEVRATPQVHEQATLAQILTKEHGKIDWSRSAREIHDHVRGLQPWPGAFTVSAGKTLKVLETRRVEGRPAVESAPPGTVIQFSKDELWVACGDGHLALLRGQLEGKKAITGGELLRGRGVIPGGVLGG